MSKVLNFGSFKRHINKFLQVFSNILSKTEMENCVNQSIFKPPAGVRGMLALDRIAFKKQVDVKAVLVPLTSMHKFQKKFKEDIIKRRGAILLDKIIDDKKKSKFVTVRQDFDFDSLPQFKQEIISNLKIEPKLYHKTMEIGYESYKHQEILGAILPAELDSTSGFERVGHIAHVNLLDHQLPYKKIIGQVLLDKHNSMKTVVNKSSTIDNTYRNFQMEVIAGEENFITKVIEFGRTYEFDFSKVFWNSRLQTEHSRLFQSIPKESVVLDVFAGVGPFSIPLAKKGCKVYANDLNEQSYKWLLHNAKLNKVKLDAFNLDGRKFIRECLGEQVRSSSSTQKIYIIMNLPALAIEFLDAFQGLAVKSYDEPLEDETDSKVNLLPAIHIFCYVFSSGEDLEGDVRKRAVQSLCTNLPEEHLLREVRKVAPGKSMLCLSFDLPTSVLLKQTETANAEEPENKKMKLSM